MPYDNPAIASLRARLIPERPAIAMSAHNPLSAKLAAEAGFDAIWGSGFELSATYAVPDANILSMDTHLELMRAMAEVQDAPVIADIDTGLRQRGQRRLSGAALRRGWGRRGSDGGQDLSEGQQPAPRRPAGCWCRSRSSRASSKPPGFAGGPLVVARTEALIAGLGQEEALRRGEAYAEAGADAVLIHSKQKTPDEILAFCRAWPGKVPLVLVPTTYPQLSFADVAALGKVGLIICGNHAIRAAVAAMRATFSRILAEGGIAGVEGKHRLGRGHLRPARRRPHARAGSPLPAVTSVTGHCEKRRDEAISIDRAEGEEIAALRSQ